MHSFRSWFALVLLMVPLAGAPAFAGSGAPPAPIQPPTPPRALVSAVDVFRKLLALTPAERDTALASRTPEQRALIESKLREYSRLSPEQRDERLRAWRMRILVRHFIRLPSSNRVDQLVSLAPADRQLVETRLREWDQMPDDLRHAVLENEWAIRILVQSDALTPSGTRHGPPAPDPEARIAHWQALPAAQRQQILEKFQHFVDDLSEKEQHKILNTLPEEERREMERTFERFARLAKDRRDLCLTNLQKFAALTPAERQQFFNNAEWWESLTPHEREVWRKFVTALNFRPPAPPPRPQSSGPVSRPVRGSSN